MENNHKQANSVKTPQIAATHNWDEYAKSVEAFNKSLHDTLVTLYARISSLENKVNALSGADLSKISNQIAADAANKLASMPINQQIVNLINTQITNALTPYINQINDSIAKFSAAINDAIQKFNAAQTTLANMQNAINQIEEKEKALSIQADQLSQRTLTISNDLTKVRQTTENEINELQGKLTKLSDDFYKGTTQINDITTKLTALENKLQEIDGTVQKLVTVVNSDTLDISSFKSRLDTIASQINAISDALTKAQQDVLTFVNSANATLGLLTRLNPDATEVTLKNYENRISGLEQQMTKAIGVINNQGKEIVEIKQNLGDINKALQEVQSKLPK
jgi:chromosome segregation ATPase